MSAPLDAARALRRRFAATAEEDDRAGTLRHANFEALHAAGLLTLTMARDLGGQGEGLATAAAVVSEVAAGCPSTALVLAMHLNNHAAIARARNWPAHLVDRVSRANREGVALLNSAQVEPRIGSPSHGGLPETVARPRGGRWVLAGHKAYATGSTSLRWATVLAVTEEAAPRLALFLVPLDAPGVRIVPTWEATGLRASASHDLLLADVEVPAEDIIDPRPASAGLVREPVGAAWFFTLIAATYDGVARAAAEWTARYAQDLSPGSLGAPIATVPRIQDGLGEIAVRLDANRRLLRSIGEEADGGTVDPRGAGTVKHVVIDNALAVTSLALDLAGNGGLSRRHPLERHHRDALCSRAHAPGNAMIRTLAAKALLASVADDPAEARAQAAPAEPVPPAVVPAAASA